MKSKDTRRDEKKIYGVWKQVHKTLCVNSICEYATAPCCDINHPEPGFCLKFEMAVRRAMRKEGKL